MKKHSILILSLLASMGAGACGSSDNGSGASGGTSGSGALAGMSGKGGAGGVTASSGGSAGVGGKQSVGGAAAGQAGGTAEGGGTAGIGGGPVDNGGTVGTTGGAAGETSGSGGTGGTDVGTAGTAGTAGGGGAGGTCDVAALQVFPRSDTDQSWDDNDFSDVTLAGTCPALVNVTWPHEAGWQNADPAEANFESTHFTLDSYTSADLTGKQLSLTIALSADQRGAAATAGGYIVSLVSVSTYDQVIAAGGAGSGGASAGTGGVDSSSGSGGAAPTTQIAYTEAELPLARRVTLSQVGDQATLTFALPNKTADVTSYDPTRVIKINIRIYSAFSNVPVSGAGGAGGTSGGGGSAGIGGSVGGSGTAGIGGASDTAGTGGADSTSGGTGGGSSGMGGSGGTGGTTLPVFDYLTSQFSITSFVIQDAQ